MKLYFISTLLALSVAHLSQAQLLKRLASNAKNALESSVNRKVDRTIDEDINGKSTVTQNTPTSSTIAVNNSTATPTLKSYSKFDFVPGDQVVYAEDFSQDVIGEFPKLWNTNGSGEIVTIDGLRGQWLHLKESTRYDAPYKKQLPDNYTLEYDVILDYKEGTWYIPALATILSSSSGKPTGLSFSFTPGWQPHGPTPDLITLNTTDNNGSVYVKAKQQQSTVLTLNNHKAIPLHVAVWVQKERVRLWVNEEKLYDLPKAMAPDVFPAFISFGVTPYKAATTDYEYYLSNIKLSAAALDTRNKFLTEGKWVTSGILFDVNSDKIKPQSYGVLKEMASVLSENPTVKAKIIGYTDSDGDAAKNIELSKRRAAAVKDALATEFNIDASRMETDGMGASKPIADNSKPEGKAQNRRVEFIKI